MAAIPPEATAVNAYLRLHVHRGDDKVISIPVLVQPDLFELCKGEDVPVRWMELVPA